MNIKVNMIKGLVLSAMLVLTTGLVGCREDKPIFDKTPDERLLDTENRVVSLLASGEHGWALQLLAGENARYGGFTCVMKFNDKGEVLASSELEMERKTKSLRYFKSLYSIARDRSTTIQFNTFNEAIHKFSSPNVGFGAGPGKGLEADFNFLIQKVSEDGNLIELIGEKRRTPARLVRLTKPADQYINEMNEMKKVMPNEATQGGKKMNGFSIDIDKKVYTFYPHSGEYSLYKVTVQGEKDYDLAYWYTDQGVRLSKPVGGVVELIYDAATKTIRTNTGAEVKELSDEVTYEFFQKFIGRYRMEFEYTDPKSKERKKGKINLQLTEKKEKAWTYNILGLAFAAEMAFNRGRRVPELRWQEIQGLRWNSNKVIASFWGPIQGGSLMEDERVGMYFDFVVGSDPEVFVLKGNSFAPESDTMATLVKLDDPESPWSVATFDENLPYLIEKVKFVRL